MKTNDYRKNYIPDGNIPHGIYNPITQRLSFSASLPQYLLVNLTSSYYSLEIANMFKKLCRMTF